MELTTVGAHGYQIGTLSAMQQFHVVRKLAPVLAGVADAMKFANALRGGGSSDMASDLASFDKIAAAVSGMSDRDSEYVIKICLNVCRRQVEGSGLARLVTADGTMTYADMKLTDMLQLTWRVLQSSLSDFFPVVPPNSPAPAAQ